MAQVRRVLAVEVGPVVQRVHLVQANVLEPLVMGLQRVEEDDRLAVGHRDDHVGARGHVGEHVLCRPRARRRDGGWHAGSLARVRGPAGSTTDAQPGLGTDAGAPRP